jgi:hypothetical protein
MAEEDILSELEAAGREFDKVLTISLPALTPIANMVVGCRDRT